MEFLKEQEEIVEGNIKAKGKYKIIHMNSKREVLGVMEFENIIVDTGLLYILQLIAKVAPQSLYISLYSGNYSPVSSDTAATFASSSNEFTGYAEANRVLWNPAVPNSGLTVSNSTSKAEFNITSAGTIYGVGLSSSPTKLSNTGIQFSGKKAAAPKAVSVGDILLIQYDITIASA